MTSLSRRTLLVVGSLATALSAGSLRTFTAGRAASAGGASTGAVDATRHRLIDVPPTAPAGAARAAGPNPYVLRLPRVPAGTIPRSTVARKGNKAAWPVLQGISIASVEIPPGAARAAHFHANAAELAIIVEGHGQVGLVAPSGERHVSDLEAGDCMYFPAAWPHWVRNTGDGPLIAIFNYNHEQPETYEVAGIAEFDVQS